MKIGLKIMKLVSTLFMISLAIFLISCGGGGNVSPSDVNLQLIKVYPTRGLVTTEAGGMDSFMVVLNTPPFYDVTIGLSSSDTSEGTVDPTSLTFTPVNWDILQTVTVSGVDDPVVDGNQVCTIITDPAVSNDPDYSGLDADDVSFINLDDDTPGITVNPSSGLVTTEAGGTDSFTVVLNTPPSDDVTIGLSSNDTTEGTVDPSSLIFTSDNWDIPQTVTVTGVDDGVDDGNQAYTVITAPASSADSDYSGTNPADVSVTNTDDDDPPTAPSNLNATAVSSNQINLSWIDNSINEDGFMIERKQSQDGNYVQIDTVEADITAYDNTDLTITVDTIYYYRIRAYNAFGESSYSNEACAAQKLIASDADAGDIFGCSVAISGDYAIVGAQNNRAAYIFHRTGTNSWDEEVKIVPPNFRDNQSFGVSVAISGDYAIVGAHYAKLEGTHSEETGAAFVFHRTGMNSWGERVKLVASDAEVDDWFGLSVSISGDYAIIGARGEDTGGIRAGAAYIFHRTGTNSWDEGVKIVASDAYAGDYFGNAVSISGDYAIVGAYNEEAGGSDAGAAYIFHRTGTNSWDEVVKIVAPDAEAYDHFGCSVAISGDYAIVGAYGEDNGGSYAGAAYIFHSTGTNSWGEGVKIVAPDAEAYDYFSTSVAISGDYTIVGACVEDAGGQDAGAAYIYRRTGTNSWNEGVKIVASDSEADDNFGVSVAISGDYTIVGASGEDAGDQNAGAAYIFY